MKYQSNFLQGETELLFWDSSNNMYTFLCNLTICNNHLHILCVYNNSRNISYIISCVFLKNLFFYQELFPQIWQIQSSCHWCKMPWRRDLACTARTIRGKVLLSWGHFLPPGSGCKCCCLKIELLTHWPVTGMVIILCLIAKEHEDIIPLFFFCVADEPKIIRSLKIYT